MNRIKQFLIKCWHWYIDYKEPTLEEDLAMRNARRWQERN